MVRLFGRLTPKKYTVIQWYTQAGNITTNIKTEVDFTLPRLSATNPVMWKCHVDGYTKGIYNMIIGRYLLT